MEGLTASELTMIRRLAGNDALIRKKTIKKLRTWLSAILRKVPDTPDCRELIENNFIRVWKALFYCMWMADKPLPQEQLAEHISSLVDIFTSKPHVINLFIEWFFRTIAREWQWIDRFRMDKFMMLIRRFFRKSLEAISKQQWKVEPLNGFLNIITVIVFNHHPEVKVTRSKARDPSPEISPLGLQIHIVDIFLEEVSKVGAHSLKSKKILKILKPFIHELSTNDDERILNEIRERIFFHLMKQSDVGIDYVEGGAPDEECIDCDNEDNSVDDEPPPSKGKKNKRKRRRNDLDSDSDDDCHVEDEGVNDEHTLASGPLDPRAGAVDVILPQLEIDYKALAERLIKVGGQKTIKMKNRKMLYSLAKQFQQLTTGRYPLAIDLEPPKPAIRHKDIEEAAKRLITFEESMENPAKKKRQPKRLRKKLGKQRLLNESQQQTVCDNSIDSSTDGDNSSIYLGDNELLDHVSDNYMSYLEELHQEDDPVDTNGVDEDDDDDENTNGIDDDEDDDDSDDDATNGINKDDVDEEDDEDDSDQNQNDDGSTFLNVCSPRPSKMRKMNNSLRFTPNLSNSPAAASSSTKRKRVSFVLARNLQHEHADYKNSIERSPAIPFDSAKKPNYGLLKSPKSSASTSLSNTPFRSRVNCSGRRASGKF